MHVIPAIDLYQGQVVRLAQGNYDCVTVYDSDPLHQAAAFAQAGAALLHIVDLDGAKTGNPLNIDIIARIAREIDIPIEVGGGVRSREVAQRLFDAGVARVVLGTKLAHDFDFVQALVSEFGPERLVAGVDARGGKVATQGWVEESTLDALELVSTLARQGLRHLVYTDISRDGMQTGIDINLYKNVAAAAGFPVIVSGGISSLLDFEQIHIAGDEIFEGVITGRALYEGAFDLHDAIATLEGNY